MNKQINISVKDLKHGDYVYNIDDTSDGQFHYVSIFDKIDEDCKFCEIVSCVYEAPQDFDDTLDNLFYFTKNEIPTTLRLASKNETRYLNALLMDDGFSFKDGKLKKID